MHALRLIGLEWAKGMGKSVNAVSSAEDGFGQNRSWMVTFVLDCLRSGWYAYTVRKEWRRAYERSFLFPLFTLFYYLLLFFTKFYLRIWNGADRIRMTKGLGRSVRTRSFFQSYRSVQKRTVAYRGQGWQAVRAGKRKKAKREDCEKAVFSFYSGNEERKKEKH